MNAGIAAFLCLVIYALGYLIYSSFLARSVFSLDDSRVTPAHNYNDGVDFVPTNKWVLFGHHYASIAGLAPMLGPAVAVIWGWLPALVWVVFGALLIGCVHDFSALVLSIRGKGQSIGAVAEQIIGPRAKTLMHIIIFFLVALAMGVFVYVIAFLFSPAPNEFQRDIHFPQAVIPSFGLMAIAVVIGFLVYKMNASWVKLAALGFGLTLVLIYFAQQDPVLSATGLNDINKAPGIKGWSMILLGYAFLASVLPVWMLLQPRDLLNSLLLYLGLTGLYLGIFVMQPEFVAPMIRTKVEGAPGIFPFVFIVIACGAASGFHSLVSSGTTSKQLNKESDARMVGYGGMIGESLLGLIAVFATTAGVMSHEKWMTIYANWGSVQGLGAKVGVFINGASTFLTGLGIDRHTGASFISIIVVSYALTSLDSATRLLRYNVEEIAKHWSIPFLNNRYLSSIVAVAAIGFFAFYEVDGKAAGLLLWGLFGTTNQLLAGLALLTVTLYLLQRGKPWVYTGIPMFFLLSQTLIAMSINLMGFYQGSKWTLFVVGLILLILAIWLVIEAVLCFIRYLHGSNCKQLDMEL